MVQEKLGFTFNDRQVARRTLISLAFSLGFVMILLLVIMKGSIELIPNNTIPTRHFVIVLLIYFFSAFIFLGLNQYAIMKARWYFNDISVNSDLAKRWFFYTLVFVLIVITVIIFLPTNFTLGFIPVAKFLSQVFIYLFALIQFVIFIPIAFLISVVNALFSGESTSEPTPQIMPEFIAPVLQQTANTAPWWEIAKSILFWFIFLAVIIFSIRYYFKNKQDFKSLFNGIRIAEWLRDFWKWISRGVRIATQAAGETFQNQFNNMRNYFKDHQIKFPALADLVRNMPPRQAVILTYLDWIRWNKSNGFDRHRSQTPIEYALAYSRTLPESAETINTFTGIFIKARYSRQTIDGSQAEKAKDLLVSLKETYRQSQKAAEIVQ